MKHFILTTLVFVFVHLLLLGLQSSLFFLPFSPPALWIVAFCYYSFSRSFFTLLFLNTILTLIFSEFSAVPPPYFFAIANFISLFAYIVRNRFHITDGQIMLCSAAATFVVNSGLWLIQLKSASIFFPNFGAWIASGIATLIISPLIFYPLRKLDQAYCHEPQEGMEYVLI